MNRNSGILSTGLSILLRNKRFVVWFYLLNLVLSILGALALQSALSRVLDLSFYSQGLLHRFDVFVLLDLLGRPELAGHGVARPHLYLTFVFVFLSVLFLPGVLDAFASERRLSREDFWATCGRNLWRFVRLFVWNLIIGGLVFAILSGINGALGKAADSSSNERLSFHVGLIGAATIFVVLTWIRLWFDLAQADIVIRDEGRVRKSLRYAAKYAAKTIGPLLGSYVAISILAVIILIGGLWFWEAVIPPASVLGAFLTGQLILMLWLAARFWQRACAVGFCLSRMQESTRDERVVAPVAPPSGPTSPVLDSGLAT